MPLAQSKAGLGAISEGGNAGSGGDATGGAVWTITPGSFNSSTDTFSNDTVTAGTGDTPGGSGGGAGAGGLAGVYGGSGTGPTGSPGSNGTAGKAGQAGSNGVATDPDTN